MKTNSQRAAKRVKRERRDNKGVNTEAKRQDRNEKIRRERAFGGDDMTEGMMLLALAAMANRSR